MSDKCNNNELMDVKSINPPDWKQNLGKADIFIYAGFLKAGYHRLLIYDPLLGRAFCKDFVVNLNLREGVYPEYPVMEGHKTMKLLRNVWKPWLEDT